MRFYEQGRAGGFEAGIRMALQAMLASPHFLFRIEADPGGFAPADPPRLPTPRRTVRAVGAPASSPGPVAPLRSGGRACGTHEGLPRTPARRSRGPLRPAPLLAGALCAPKRSVSSRPA